MIRHVTIIGSGFSGTLHAINLLRHEGPRVTLIERKPVLGRGLAFGRAHPSHLLNVRAANMSAFPEDPDHFIRWLSDRNDDAGPTAFVPRALYGEYLRELLSDVHALAGDRLAIVVGEAIDLERTGAGVVVRLADGRTVASDAAVLALGNLPPHTPPGIGQAALPADLYAADPWSPAIGNDLCDDDDVLIVGTGLTMVDTVLRLAARGFGGRIVALSRRGLLPHRHAAPAPWQRLAERPRLSASALVRAVRRRSEAVGWRNAVDELRPFTQAMWAQASAAERGRFLRHLRPWWDIHRHRLAPTVAEAIDDFRATDRLEPAAGKIVSTAVEGKHVRVTWRARGADEPRTGLFRRIVNCTGPQGDLQRTSEPLLATLAARGMIRADPEHLGIDVDHGARTIDIGGRPNDDLFALGPMTRGAFWEVVAVPDIRRQAWDLARRIANAHWVGWEGL